MASMGGSGFSYDYISKIKFYIFLHSFVLAVASITLILLQVFSMFHGATNYYAGIWVGSFQLLTSLTPLITVRLLSRASIMISLVFHMLGAIGGGIGFLSCNIVSLVVYKQNSSERAYTEMLILVGSVCSIVELVFVIMLSRGVTNAATAPRNTTTSQPVVAANLHYKHARHR